MEKKTQIAVVSSPWFSNLTSTFEFSKRFAYLHPDFDVTFLITILESPPSAFISRLGTSVPPNLNPILLPPISKHDLPPQASPILQMKFTVTKSLPHIYDKLMSLKSKSCSNLAALIADPFATDALDLAKELKIMSFPFITVGVTALSVFYQLPELYEMSSCEFRDLREPIRIPGCVQLHGRDLPRPVQDRSSPGCKQFLQMNKKLHSADGFLVNSFMEMEEGPAKAFRENHTNSLVYLIGPLTQKECYSKEGSGSDSDSDSESLRWLENQPPKSVLYINFGSGGLLSQHQTNELALGLELSGKKFLWVLRPPSDAASSFSLDEANEDPLRFLPEGFLERTKDQGLVVPLWAPQIPILRHGSTAGFLSHCGWNSVMESVEYGVPVIAWPLFAEQRINATLLTNGLKVALWPKVNENGIVQKEEISKVIKSLMEDEEGKEIYKRIEGLKDAATNAVKYDGSSTKALNEVAMKWKNFRGV